jgi:hypothetical protein
MGSPGKLLSTSCELIYRLSRSSRRKEDTLQGAHKAIQQEVNRLLEVRFTRPVDYPSWLVISILVEKSDGS